jgi:hypothetical protein
MLALKNILWIFAIGFAIYNFIDTYQKEKSNGLEGRQALQKAGTSAFGILRTAATFVFFLFGPLGGDISHDATMTDPRGADVSQSATQTNIGFVNAIHNDVPTSNHDAFDTHDTTEMPSSNGWDFAASAVPWIIGAVGIGIIAPEVLPFLFGAM